MKKQFSTIGLIVILAITTTTLFYACKKDKSLVHNETSLKDIQIKVNHNWIVFNSAKQYRNINSSNTLDNVISRIKGLNQFKPYSTVVKNKSGVKSTNNELIQSEALKEILNEDLVLQIEDKLFKLEPTSERVFVLNDAALGNDINQYNDLVRGDLSNPNISSYSFEDDIIEILFPNIDEVQIGAKSSCGESGVGGDFNEKFGSFTDNINYYGQWDSHIAVRYKKYGVWFSLFAYADCTTPTRAGHTTSSPWLSRLIKIDVYPAAAKPKCRNLIGPYSGWWVAGKIETTAAYIETNYNYYDGGRGLSKFHLLAAVRVGIYNSAIGNNSTEFSQLNVIAEIRKNM